MMLDHTDLVSSGSEWPSQPQPLGVFHPRRVVVLANRGPVRHERGSDGEIVARRSSGGLVAALEPLLETCSGTWIAHAAGDADIDVGSRYQGAGADSASRYHTRYVDIPPFIHRGYYYGFANEGLWPLCHSVGVQPVFRPSDFRAYAAANVRFVDAVAEETSDSRPIVLVQDYHFALAPILIRERAPGSTIVVFWHIPWPEPRVFRTCPWATELIDGLLGSDIVGLQTDEDCANFVDTVDAILGVDVDRAARTVRYQGRSVAIRPYPVGVDGGRMVRTLPPVDVCRERVRRDFELPANAMLCLGVDRLDYTKGLHQKLLAVECLLDGYPELRGRFSFLQIAEPSRECLREYRNARAHLTDTARRVNQRFGTSTYRPVHLLETHYEPDDVYRMYRAADVCYVGSLRDGMNLVAKEFVCARTDHAGVLVLSAFTGAARQLSEALVINPLAIDTAADALARAIAMPPDEQAQRMLKLRANVSRYDARWWASRLLTDALAVTQESQIAVA